MSNLEPRPGETPTGGLATVSPVPVLELLAPREVPLGGPRAMLVRRTLPHRQVRTVGAWCFLDDYGPGEPRMAVPPHPHTGLATVTWLLSGEVLHQDSVGSEAVVRPGALSLMTAGRGIAHAETSVAGTAAPVLRGVQLWVALPGPARDVAPGFEHHGELPVVGAGGLAATVFLGALAGVTSPATVHSPIVGADVAVRGAGRLPLLPDWEHAVLALGPGLTVDGAAVAEGTLAYLGTGREGLELAGDSRALLLGGEPFAEDLLMWWNFVGRSHEEVVARREEWMRAVAGEATRFGQVQGYAGAALPAPALPGTRLRPRPGHTRAPSPSRS